MWRDDLRDSLRSIRQDLRGTLLAVSLLAGVPTRVVAVSCDTSVTMLERSYSAYIADHSDAVGRRALLDLSVQP